MFSLQHILFPEATSDATRAVWLDDSEDGEEPRRRRIYRMPERASINTWDEVEFFRRFRLSKRTFLMVLHLVGPILQHPHPRPRYIAPEHQLLITLRFMASGSMQLTVADAVHVSTASVCHILPKVCMALIKNLREYVKMPKTLNERMHAAAEFFQIASFPRTIEAGDYGQHILVGDSGYANTHYLATPFTASNRNIATNHGMQTYQERIIRTRNVVERQYGVMKRRFPVLAYGMRVEVATAQKIIVACAILHNICIDAKEMQPPQDTEDEERLRRLLIENQDDDIPHGDQVDGPSQQHRSRRNTRDEIISQINE